MIVGELDKILPRKKSISIHSKHLFAEIEIWLKGMKFEREIYVYDKFDAIKSNNSFAAIVANAAASHGEAVRWALQSRVPVLVEKPLALSSVEACSLIELASELQVKLATAHVFLFNKYLTNFRSILPEFFEIDRICIRWIDPRYETRHGEAKRYDHRVPIFVDLFPHIMSILNVFTPNIDAKLLDLNVFRGGAHLEVKMNIDSVNCIVSIERNGFARKREIEVSRFGEIIGMLDFTNEPGFIVDGNVWNIADSNWNQTTKPIATMLSAFLSWAEDGVIDQRLDPRIAISAFNIIDQVFPRYRLTRDDWLDHHLSVHRTELGADIAYALNEKFNATSTLYTNSELLKIAQNYSFIK